MKPWKLWVLRAAAASLALATIVGFGWRAAAVRASVAELEDRGAVVLFDAPAPYGDPNDGFRGVKRWRASDVAATFYREAIYGVSLVDLGEEGARGHEFEDLKHGGAVSWPKTQFSRGHGPLTLEEIRPLFDFHQLRALRIENRLLDREAWTLVGKLGSLESLWVGAIQFDAAQLDAIEHLPRLRLLRVQYWNLISRERLHAFQSRHPNCVILCCCLGTNIPLSPEPAASDESPRN